MLNAPNGYPTRADKSLGLHKMPDGYELWTDEDGYYWWHETATERESEMCWDRWRVRREAIADAKSRKS